MYSGTGWNIDGCKGIQWEIGAYIGGGNAEVALGTFKDIGQ